MSRPTFLTNRTRIAVAIALTVILLAPALRGAITHGHGSGRVLLGCIFALNGLPLIVLNIAFYAFLWWLAVSFIRGTTGRERVFMVAWFTELLLSPIRALGTEWRAAQHLIGSIALSVALVAAISLFRKQGEVDSNGTIAVQ